jgi:uncharacterized protein (TIGR02145 family)
MKRFYIFTLGVLLTVSLFAQQAPQSFSYQAVVRGTNNTLVTNKTVGMKISLLQGSNYSWLAYAETHTPTSNENGLVSIAIGGGTKVSGNFAMIDWSKGPYLVKTDIDPTGGSNYSLTSVSQLLSVPYALYAANSKPGPKGDKGDFGKDGAQGLVGPKGETGAQGLPGKDGVDGKDEQKLSVSLTGDTMYLTNGNFVIIPGISSANTKPKPNSGDGYGQNIIDVDGNLYKTVKIGTQQWMAENLKVSKYNDGTTISNITDMTGWLNYQRGAWAFYNNDAVNNAKYGKLYNWYVVSPATNGNKNVCPTGWHVPTDAEWTVLTDYLGGLIVAGGKMKEVGTTSWYSPNTIATNTSLFSALPGGLRFDMGNFNFIGSYGYWWSSSEVNAFGAWARNLNNDFGYTYRYDYSKRYGFSVRCLRD